MRNYNEMTPKFVRDILEFLASLAVNGSVEQIKRTHRKIGRNETCRCNSGKKYKYCHWAGDVQRGIR